VNPSEVLRQVAAEFPGVGKDTILYENYGKHLHEIALIQRYMPSDGKLLDLGGGDGVNLIVLDRLGVKSERVLLDRWQEQGNCNRMGDGSRPLAVTQDADIQVVEHSFWPEPDLPFPNDYFDIVTIFDVLEHLPGNPTALLNDVRRITKPGGVVIVGGPNYAALMRRIELLSGEHPYMPFDLWMRPNYGDHFREYTRSEYRELMKRSGIEPNAGEMVVEPTSTRARNRYHNKVYPRIHPVTVALWGLLIIEKLLPSLRPAVYVVGKV